MPEVIKKRENPIYVDDLSTGADEPNGDIELYKVAESIFAEANMNSRKW